MSELSELVFLSNVRLSFPHFVEPQKKVNQVTGQEKISYNCEFLMTQDHPGLHQFMKRYGELAIEKWGEHAQTIMGMLQNERKSRCYGRGDEKVSKKTLLPYDGYSGHMYITAGRDTRPQLIQQDGTPVKADNLLAYQTVARKLYGGCRVNAAVKPWIQDSKEYGRGIRCDLIAVQFFADDVPFEGNSQVDASKLFGAVANAPSVQPQGVPGLPPFMTGAPAAPQMPAAPFQGVPGLPPFMTGQ